MSDDDPRDYRSLGDLLRDAREEKELSFEQLNEATRISVRVLQAIEQDDLEGASGLIYMRGFVRTLATFHDLDPDWLGAKLDALAGETSRPVMPVDGEDEVIAGPVADPVIDEEPEDTGPKWEVESTRIRHVGATSTPRVSRNLIYGLVAVLVMTIVLVWWIGRDGGAGEKSADNSIPTRTERVSLDAEPAPDHSGNQQEQAEPENQADANSASSPDRTTTEETPADPVLEVDTSVPETALAVEEETSTSSTQEDDAPVQDAPIEPVTVDPAPQRMVEVEDSDSAPQTGLTSVLRPAEGGASAQMELLVVAEGPVEVTLSSGGVRQQTRFLNTGEEWRVRGSDHFSLAVTDPAAVRLEVDGRARPLPVNWSGEEWILYPPLADGGER